MAARSDRLFTHDELSKRKCDELRNILRSMNLRISGVKSQLISRILEHQSKAPASNVSVLVVNEKTNCQQFLLLPDLCSSPIVEYDDNADMQNGRQHDCFFGNGSLMPFQDLGYVGLSQNETNVSENNKASDHHSDSLLEQKIVELERQISELQTKPIKGTRSHEAKHSFLRPSDKTLVHEKSMSLTNVSAISNAIVVNSSLSNVDKGLSVPRSSGHDIVHKSSSNFLHSSKHAVVQSRLHAHVDKSPVVSKSNIVYEYEQNSVTPKSGCNNYSRLPSCINKEQTNTMPSILFMSPRSNINFGKLPVSAKVGVGVAPNYNREALAHDMPLITQTRLDNEIYEVDKLESNLESVVVSPPPLFKNRYDNSTIIKPVSTPVTQSPDSPDPFLSRLLSRTQSRTEIPIPTYTLAQQSYGVIGQRVPKCDITTSVQHPSLHQRSHSPAPQAIQFAAKREPDPDSGLKALIHTLSEKLDPSNQLPPPQPFVFDGDLLTFNDWNLAFKAMIERKKSLTNEARLYYLKQYLTGEPLRVVDGFISYDNPYAYEEAKSLIDDTYGDTYRISEAYLSRLETWSKIPSTGQAKALRDLTHFLIKCESAMRHVPEMSILNHNRQNQKILQLLPDYMINKWNERVLKHKKSSGGFPSFPKFVDFIKEQSELANLPVTSLEAVKEASKVKQPQLKLSLKTASTELPLCCVCNGNHKPYKCSKLAEMAVPERFSTAKQLKLCFLCLNQDHFSKECPLKYQSLCKVCKGNHNTLLHKEHEVAAVNFASSDEDQQLTSSIVPVWIRGKSGRQMLTYAMLDSQSD